MPTFWIIDTKVQVLPKSSLPQDGSNYYFGRSVVPEDSKEEAIAKLTAALEEDFMTVVEVTSAVDHESKIWDSKEDEDFETNESLEKSKLTGNIELGCFISELSLEG